MEAVDLSGAQPLIHDEDGEVTPEQLAELLSGAGAPPQGPSELEIAVAGRLSEVTIPAIIELDDGRIFEVNDMRAWGWTPFGIYAVGRFDTDPEDVERNRLFAGKNIYSIELQAEAYEKFVEAYEDSESEEAPEAEVVEEEQPGDESDAESSSG